MISSFKRQTLKRELSTPATTHWGWKPIRQVFSKLQCNCGYNLSYILIPIFKKGAQKKALYTCPGCYKKWSMYDNRCKYSYILTREGWLRK